MSIFVPFLNKSIDLGAKDNAILLAKKSLQSRETIERMAAMRQEAFNRLRKYCVIKIEDGIEKKIAFNVPRSEAEIIIHSQKTKSRMIGDEIEYTTTFEIREDN